MTAHTSGFTLFLTLIASCLLILGGCCERQLASHNQSTLDAADSGRNISLRTRLPRPYGKMKVPAELFADLIQPEHVTDPVKIQVSASTSVVTGSGVMTLKVPEIGGEPGRTEVLWTGVPSDYLAESMEYTVPPLPVGRYQFVAIIEFTPDYEDADSLALSESLYVDVRADELLASNVSFRHIERLELYRDLEARALANLSRASASQKAQTQTRYHTLMADADADLVEREIARLKARDPDVARQIMALNRSNAESQLDGDTARSHEPERPVLEKAVPIRRNAGQ